MKICRLLSALLVAILSSSASGEGVAPNDEQSSPSNERAATSSISGKVSADYFRSTRELDDKTNLFGLWLQPKLSASIGDALRFNAEGRANVAMGEGETRSQGQAIEAYVDTKFRWGDVRFGKQIVAWGRADGINPTDNLTPRDYTVLLAETDEQRLGTNAVYGNVFFADRATLSLFATTSFLPSVVPLPTIPGAIVVENAPGSTIKNQEIGAKIDNAGGNVDWSVSYFNGYNLIPTLRLVNTGPSEIVIAKNYNRIQVVGGDLAFNIDTFGVRGEFAYVNTDDRSGADYATINPMLSIVFGVDSAVATDGYANVQMIYRRVFHYSPDANVGNAVESALAAINATLNQQLAQDTYGASLKVTWKWLNDSLQAEATVVHYMPFPSTYLHPLIRYAVTDNISLKLGLDRYWGKETSFFGSQKKNNNVFMELQYSF